MTNAWKFALSCDSWHSFCLASTAFVSFMQFTCYLQISSACPEDRQNLLAANVSGQIVGFPYGVEQNFDKYITKVDIEKVVEMQKLI